MTEPVLNTSFERSQFSDEAYGALGRALCFAEEYEANCRALAVVLGLKTANGKENLPLSDHQRAELVVRLWKRRLYDHIKDLVGKQEVVPGDLGDILTKARNSRNAIAHDLPNGLRDVLEKDEARSWFLAQLRETTVILAKANFLICFMLALVTNEPPPLIDCVDEYIRNTELWVTEVEI